MKIAPRIRPDHYRHQETMDDVRFVWPADEATALEQATALADEFNRERAGKPSQQAYDRVWNEYLAPRARRLREEFKREQEWRLAEWRRSDAYKGTVRRRGGRTEAVFGSAPPSGYVVPQLSEDEVDVRAFELAVEEVRANRKSQDQGMRKIEAMLRQTAAANLLQRDPGRSDRDVARRVGISPTIAGRVRKRMLSNGLLPPE